MTKRTAVIKLTTFLIDNFKGFTFDSYDAQIILDFLKNEKIMLPLSSLHEWDKVNLTPCKECAKVNGCIITHDYAFTPTEQPAPCPYFKKEEIK